LRYLPRKVVVHNGVKIIYGKLLTFFQQYMIAVHTRLTLDILKKLDDFDFVIEVLGDYTGTLTGRGASHEPRGHTR
jgi:hypothetical protein